MMRKIAHPKHNFEVMFRGGTTTELKMIASLTPYLVQSCNKITANTIVKLSCHISLQCLEGSNLIYIQLETDVHFILVVNCNGVGCLAQKVTKLARFCRCVTINTGVYFLLQCQFVLI